MMIFKRRDGNSARVFRLKNRTAGSTLFMICAVAGFFLCPKASFAQNTPNPHPLMANFIGVNTRGSDDISFLKKFGALREYHGWDIAYDPDNIANCPVQKLMFNPGTDQSTLSNFDGFYSQLNSKVSPALKWLAPEMRGLMNYDQIVLEQKPWCVDGLTGIGLPPNNPPLSNEQRAAPFQFNTITRNVNNELIAPGNRFFKNYASISPGENYSVDVSFSFNLNCYGRYLKAWLDADGNGTLDNSEAVFTSSKLGNDPPPAYSGNVSFNFNLPGSPANKILKLRMALLSNGDQNILEACAANGLGGGQEVFIYDLALINDQGTLIQVNNYCDPGVKSSGFDKGFIQSVTIKKVSTNTVIYQKTLKDAPPSNYFNDGTIGRMIQGVNYSIVLDDSPDTKSATVEIDANFDGDFADAGESKTFPTDVSVTIPVNPANIGLTVIRITHRNASGQVTGIWEYPVLVTQQNGQFSNPLSSPLLGTAPFSATVQANSTGDNSLIVNHKIALPVNQEAPSTYLEYTKWVTALSGRYGSVKVCNNPANPYCTFLSQMVDVQDAGGASASGKKLLKYVEMGNEPDKYWYDAEFRNTNDAVWQMMPRQYAALLHAAYDGGASSPDFNLNSSGSFLGVKNIDPGMKVVLGGISEFRGGYIHDMLDMFWELRQNTGKIIPFDVMNIHHYSGSTTSTTAYLGSCWQFPYDYDGLTGGRGFCPEHAKLKERYHDFIGRMVSEAANAKIKMELEDMEYWLSEFGYSTNDNSVLKAKLDNPFSQPYFKTQAQWLVRSLLELSAMEYKVDEEKKIVLSKAHIYELRDYYPSSGSGNSDFSPGGDLFSHHGLLTQDFKPKKSWYYVMTTKNVLGQSRFTKDLNPDTDPDDPNYTQLQFDNGGEAPRIYYYKTAGNQRILAIWSPTANKSENQSLKINIPNWLAGRINEPGFDNPLITAYTIIQIKDNSEYGFRSGFDVQTISGDRHLVFNNTTVPISETPIFVLLGVKQNDPVIDCPLTNEKAPTATPYCTSALLEWGAALPGTWRIFVAKKSDLPNLATCDDYKDIDLLGNHFVFTSTFDLSASRTRYLLDGLTPNTEYVTFMLYVKNNRVPALHPCVVCFSTTSTGTCTINPCLKVEPLSGSGSCPNSQPDYCKLVLPDNGANCFGSAGDLCTSGDPSGISCTSYMTPNLSDAMFKVENLWAGCQPYEVVVTFKDYILLDAIKFFHLQGLDHVAIYYSTCDCPDEKRYLTTFKPYQSYQEWVSITNNLPILPIKKLYFKKLSAYGNGRTANVVIGNLHFCGKEVTECYESLPGFTTGPPVRKGVFESVWTEPFNEQDLSLSWSPVKRIANREEFGTFPNYEVYVAKRYAGQAAQFNLSAPMKVYHFEGVESVSLPLSGLDAGSDYDALIRVIDYPYPCPLTIPADQFKQSRDYGLYDDPIADTLVTFNTGRIEDRDETIRQMLESPGNPIALYPNPTTGTIYAQWKEYGYETVQIWTAEGRLIREISISADALDLTFDMGTVSSGLFIVKFIGKNRPIQQKKLILMR